MSYSCFDRQTAYITEFACFVCLRHSCFDFRTESSVIFDGFASNTLFFPNQKTAVSHGGFDADLDERGSRY